MVDNFQEKNWGGEHGDEYNKRNPQTPEEMDRLYLENYGNITRSQLNEEFLGGLGRGIKVLEVGANVGVQLAFLQKMGLEKLYGVDINREAIEISKANFKGVDIILASALDLPFRDNYFDLVFTSGVLIHISSENVKKAMQEIYRCSSKYIWGFEYYASEYTEILYRGKPNMLWKADFAKIYLNSFPDLALLKERKVKYLDSDKIDVMFLLEKK